MRVWICNPFDDIPGEGPPLRYHTLCRVMAGAGHDVTWWSADFSHRRKARRMAPPKLGLPFALRLLHVRAYPRNVGLARFLSHRDYARGLWKSARAEIAAGRTAPPDCVFVSLPPLDTAGVARRLRGEFGCRVVVDVMDAWPETFERILPGPQRVRRAAGVALLAPFRRAARRAYRGADAITGAAQAYLDLARSYGATAPRHLCYHCMDIGPPPPPRARQADEPLRLVYIGSMERAYDLETLLLAVADARSEGMAVTLDLAGGGSMEAGLRNLGGALGITEAGQVRFHGPLDRPALDALLARAHAGVVPMDPASGVAVPYKAADYAAAGLPMLSCLGNELGTLLDEFEAGTPYAFRDPPSMLAALRKYLADTELLSRHSSGARALAEARFDRAREYPKLAAFIEST
ncbi:MAG: glycosyltransferase [Opitutales bacterium]|nr:glycosyltransferase [Opitutales bacterium]